MRSILWSSLVVLMLAGVARAQRPDTVQTPPSAPAEDKSRNVFFGGTIGLSFGSYFRVAVQPLIGMQFTPQFSGGVKLGYEYISQDINGTTVTWHNYGGSVFTRYRFVPQAYLHGEFAYMSYGVQLPAGASERRWVPFILLGGGYVQPISRNSYAFVEVLFDVLQDANSPYERWRPWVNVGVSVGI